MEPVIPADPRFDSIINEGTVKWAVLQDNSLVVVPAHVATEEISHAVLSGGDGVPAAGTAEIAGDAANGYFGTDIDNHSGHYEPLAESLQIGVSAFARNGIVFDESVQSTHPASRGN